MAGEDDDLDLEEEIEDEVEDTGPDYNSMSDEDFLSKVPEPTGSVQVQSESAAEETSEEEDQDEEEQKDTQAEAESEEAGDQPADEGTEAEAGDKKKQEDKADEKSADDASKTNEQEPDYKALYSQLMASFKANGAKFTPQSPDEVIRLAQQGINYTQKMQALKPHLKLLRMLENNSLLDESKISYLIDLDKKNPAAIQKLVHDSKIDPMDIDTSAEPKYIPGNHTVSDAEMEFHEVLSDVSLTDHGKETISLISKQWDQTSKETVLKEPALLKIMNDQRANGIYDRISAEIDRQRILGNIPVGTPFIHAYKAVGDRLQAEGQLTPAALGRAPKVETPVPGAIPLQRQVLETRAAQPRKPVVNGDKAKAASATPASAKSAKVAFDPFNMTDEQIMAIQAPPLK